VGADTGPRVILPAAERQPDLVQASSWLFLALLGNNACNYIFHSLASRALGPEDYGTLVSLLALVIPGLRKAFWGMAPGKIVRPLIVAAASAPPCAFACLLPITLQSLRTLRAPRPPPARR